MRIKNLWFFALILFFIPTKILADTNFDISSKDTFTISSDGLAKITQNIVITNKTKYMYTPTYSVNVMFSDIADVKATGSAGLLKTDVLKNGKSSTILVHFPKKIIGKGTKNKFSVSYMTSQAATQKKNGWEVVIPGVANPEDFKNYIIELNISPDLGLLAIVSPIEKTRNGNTYTFQKENFSSNGIYMLFKEDDGTSIKQVVKADFPQNVLIGFPVSGRVSIQNSTDETIENKQLIVSTNLPLVDKSYTVKKLGPYATVVVPVDLGRPPLLTMGEFEVKISFDGSQTKHKLNVGLLPDYYLIFLGGIIFVGSIIVAVVTAKTWRIYIQKRKK